MYVIQYRITKKIWVEALAYVCYLVNRLPSSVIEGKTPLEVWSGKAAQNYDSLRVFGLKIHLEGGE